MGGLKGKTICFTGTLQGMKRADAAAKATKAGAIVKSSVVKTLDYLVACEGAGSKLASAGPDTEIITQDEFEAMLGGGKGKSPSKAAKPTRKISRKDESSSDEDSDESSEPVKKRVPKKKLGGGLKGKTICFTGTLQGMKRADAAAKATKAGAIVKSSVVKTLDYLVACEGAGSKVDSAGPNTEIITQDEFEAMLGGGKGKSPSKAAKPTRKISKKDESSSDEDSDESSEPVKKRVPKKKLGGGLKGKTICFTGTLQGMKRADAAAKATKAGAIVKSSVVKTLDYLVACEGAGSKLASAGPDTEIITQDEFEAML
eukprot:TRINITY_DN564_c1_g1_i11.p1 TRINITY_DN564_c1_g1~~TRINITY_DN564_c1_g1_i11.p1  ORF type:complete len:315 (+),score=92.21 TRINITY_DN564_c1_g1_i11:701-1645(+)